VRWAVSTAVCLLLAVAPELFADTLDIYFINVGQGDAMLVDCGDWEALLDAGPGTRDANAELIGVLTKQIGDGDLELGILSHPHEDHYGGFLSVLDRFDVLSFWRSTDLAPDTCGKHYGAFADALVAEGLDLQPMTAGDQSAHGSLSWIVLGPQEQKTSPASDNDNENSLVLLLSFGGIRFLFTGDIQTEAATTLARLELGDDPIVLKVPHHGAENAASILDATSSSLATSVISAGEGNRYGHPDIDLVISLAELGPVFMTTCGCSEDCFAAADAESEYDIWANTGTIHMWTDGQSLWVKSPSTPVMVLVDGSD